MIVEYIRYSIKEENQSGFEVAYTKASEALLASTHCQSYELSKCVEEPERYILRIVWDSLDGHMKGFRSSAEFKEFLPHIRPFIQNIDEMQHYELTSIVGSK